MGVRFEPVAGNADDIGHGAGPQRCRCLLLQVDAQTGGLGGRLVSTSALLLWVPLESTYARLGFDAINDDAFKVMMLVLINEPTSKTDTIRAQGTVGSLDPSLRTLFRAHNAYRSVTTAT